MAEKTNACYCPFTLGDVNPFFSSSIAMPPNTKYHKFKKQLNN